MREDILEYYKEQGIQFEIHSDIAAIIDKADVIYMTRAQKERMKEGEKADGSGVVLNRELLDKVQEKSICIYCFGFPSFLLPLAGLVKTMAVTGQPRSTPPSCLCAPSHT
jgi:hypothetical protein